METWKWPKVLNGFKREERKDREADEPSVFPGKFFIPNKAEQTRTEPNRSLHFAVAMIGGRRCTEWFGVPQGGTGEF